MHNSFPNMIAFSGFERLYLMVLRCFHEAKGILANGNVTLGQVGELIEYAVSVRMSLHELEQTTLASPSLTKYVPSSKFLQDYFQELEGMAKERRNDLERLQRLQVERF